MCKGFCCVYLLSGLLTEYLFYLLPPFGCTTFPIIVSFSPGRQAIEIFGTLCSGVVDACFDFPVRARRVDGLGCWNDDATVMKDGMTHGMTDGMMDGTMNLLIFSRFDFNAYKPTFYPR